MDASEAARRTGRRVASEKKCKRRVSGLEERGGRRDKD